MHPLAKGIKKGEIRALARAISYIESNHEDKLTILRDVYSYPTKTYIVGVTGPPGSGKSTLVNQLIYYLRSLSLKVGVIGVDPTSPFHGGALLGDRIRMEEHFSDSEVFIRSMGSRGSLGGIARSTKEVIRLMTAYGFDVIIIETVGVGQSEINIVSIADSTMVLLTPTGGDVVQVFKAGIMEIADIYVINKADLPGASRLEMEIKRLLRQTEAGWRPPILKTISTQNQGINELWTAMNKHRSYLLESGEKGKKQIEIVKDEIIDRMEEELRKKVREFCEQNISDVLEQVVTGKRDLYSATEIALSRWCANESKKE